MHDLADREFSNNLGQIEREIADRALGWHAATGARIVHWGGAAHVLAGDPRGVAAGGEPDPALTHRNAGGHLRAALGTGYAAVAVTVGTVEAGSGHVAVPSAPPSFAESALDTASDVSWLATRDASADLHAWLDAPLRTRSIGPTYDPGRDAEHFITAPRIRDAADAFLHVPHSAAVAPL